MIDKRKILESASAFTLQPGVVEKDYALGWLQAGIYAHPELIDSWVFKVGTCLKKCFFETYRFSEDLDFTMRDEAQLEDGFLRRVMGEVIAWVADESGLVMPAGQLSFDIHPNPRGRLSCQAKIGYRGPVSLTSNAGGGRRSSSIQLPMNGSCFLLCGARCFIRTRTARRPGSRSTAIHTRKRSARKSARLASAHVRVTSTT